MELATEEESTTSTTGQMGWCNETSVEREKEKREGEAQRMMMLKKIDSCGIYEELIYED